MPLIRDKIVGRDVERLAFRFTMLNGEEVVECQISDAALDLLAGMKGTERVVRQAQFVSLRSTIEAIASDIYDRVPLVSGQPVRIFTKDLPAPGQDEPGKTAIGL